MAQVAMQPVATGGMNQMLEIFKMQYLMKFMDGSSSASGSRQQGYQQFMGMFILMAYDNFAKYVPFWLGLFWSWFILNHGERFGFDVPKKLQKPLLQASPPPPASKQIRAFIQFERNPEQKLNDQRIDAVLHHVCNLPEVSSLRFNGIEMIPNFKDTLMIDNDIWFEIISSSSGSSVLQTSGSISSNQPQVRVEPILYRLSTYDHDITWLHRFVDTAIERFEQEKKNKLGSEMYYFDQFVMNGKFSNPLPKQSCYFTKSKFFSNRTLENVYLRQIGELKDRVEFFMRRRDWYDSKGIPHTLGIVMYGHPGCGKTSTIKAIANETKRHIFNIALSEIKTKAALKELFYNDTVHIMETGRTEILNIPVKQRLYVIEDIDAMDSVVIKRSKDANEEEQIEKYKKEAEKKLLEETHGAANAARMLEGRNDEDSDKLDLSTLLNVLDGVRETPGRIIILSTNYPERLDEALLRPGRFDILVEFEKHPVEVIRMHMEKYYDITLREEQWAKLNQPGNNRKWTPAEISQILFRHLHSPDAAIEEICKEDPAKLFKFSQLKREDDAVTLVATIEETGTSLEEILKESDRSQELSIPVAAQSNFVEVICPVSTIIESLDKPTHKSLEDFKKMETSTMVEYRNFPVTKEEAERIDKEYRYNLIKEGEAERLELQKKFGLIHSNMSDYYISTVMKPVDRWDNNTAEFMNFLTPVQGLVQESEESPGSKGIIFTKNGFERDNPLVSLDEVYKVDTTDWQPLG